MVDSFGLAVRNKLVVLLSKRHRAFLYRNSVNTNKKGVLSQGNRAMPKLFFSVESLPTIHYKFTTVAKLRKPGFRAPNIPAQNRI